MGFSDWKNDENVGWQNQDVVYIVMYQSRKSGGTYTEVRRTRRGLVRLLETLKLLGYSDHEISVTEQKKKWLPEPKVKTRTGRKAKVTVDKPVRDSSKVVPFVARG